MPALNAANSCLLDETNSKNIEEIRMISGPFSGALRAVCSKVTHCTHDEKDGHWVGKAPFFFQNRVEFEWVLGAVARCHTNQTQLTVMHWKTAM